MEIPGYKSACIGIRFIKGYDLEYAHAVSMGQWQPGEEIPSVDNIRLVQEYKGFYMPQDVHQFYGYSNLLYECDFSQFCHRLELFFDSGISNGKGRRTL